MPEFNLVTHEELVQADIPDQPSLMGNGLLIPNGRLVVYGAPRAFKSFLVQQLLYYLSTGQDWYGFEAHGKYQTLYVQVEILPVQLQQRARALDEFAGVPAAPGPTYSIEFDYTLDSKAEAQRLAEAIKRVGAEVVMLDPLNLMMVGSENDDRAARAFVKFLNVVRQDTGALLGFVHHSNKGMWHEGKKVDRGLADLSGSKGFGSWADTVMKVARIQGVKDTAEVVWEKVRNGPEPPSMWLHLNTEKLVLERAVNDPKVLVLGMLEAGPVPIQEIDKTLKGKCSMGGAAARAFRQEMVGQGWVDEKRDPTNAKRKLLVRA